MFRMCIVLLTNIYIIHYNKHLFIYILTLHKLKLYQFQSEDIENQIEHDNKLLFKSV